MIAVPFRHFGTSKFELKSKVLLLTLPNIFGLLVGYLVGSIPSAVWVGRTFYGIDVREYGSGNAGATNTFRVLGKKPGIAVLIMDALKGFLAVKLAYILGDYDSHSPEFIDFELALAVTALLGHIFPVYVGFRGGKGVATMLGILVAIHPEAAGICAGIFVITLYISGHVSLSSMISGITFPIVIMVFYSTNSSINIFSLAVAIMILVTHQRNIERIIRGEESVVKWSLRAKRLKAKG
jgi:glycerol-3-phosphate acyltransferase PlsY